MTINHKIWDFPVSDIESQLFHVPGAAFNGGLTSGGAVISSPEPGGLAVLETKISLQTNEWKVPASSWIMSKVNGSIFRIKLVKTPQLVFPSGVSPVDAGTSPWSIDGTANENAWDNDQEWDNDGFYLSATNSSSLGSTEIRLSTGSNGDILKHGHVIGFQNYSYIIDDIEYENTLAIITISPPLRNNIVAGDMILMQPYFTGSIANGDQIKADYRAANNGTIQLGTIIFNEVIL